MTSLNGDRITGSDLLGEEVLASSFVRWDGYVGIMAQDGRVFLFSQAVPEPSGFVLGVGVIAIMVSRRRIRITNKR